MDKVTDAIKGARSMEKREVLTRDGFVKADKPAEGADDMGSGAEQRAVARQLTRDAAAATLSIPHDKATAGEHQAAAKAHRDAADAHKSAASASTKHDDIVMHTATSGYHRAQADEHDKCATASGC